MQASQPPPVQAPAPQPPTAPAQPYHASAPAPVQQQPHPPPANAPAPQVVVHSTQYQPVPQQQTQQQHAPPPAQYYQQHPPGAPPPGAAPQPPAPGAPPPAQPPAQAGAPPAQNQHYPHQGLNGGWQSDQDYQERRKMIAKIVHLLKQRKPNAPPDWLKKLPQMAKRLEESLYRSAKSFEEYNAGSTLKQRLQQLAHNIGMKTKRMQQAQIAQRQQQQQQQQHHAQAKQAQYMVTSQQPIAPQPQQHQQAAPQMQQAPPPQALQQPPPRQHAPPQQTYQHPPPQQQQQVHQQQPPPAQHQPTMQHQQQMQHQQPPPQQHQQPPHQHPPQPQTRQHAPPPQYAPPHQQQQQGGNRIVNMAEINPIMTSQPQMVQPSAPAPVQPAPVPMQQQQYQPMPQQPQAPAPPQPSVQAPAPIQAAAPGAPANGQRPAGQRQVSDRQQVLRHQQQRLLLLRHAAKCQHEDGRCPVTPHCAGMKRLWKHIAECKDQKCLVPHCVSSRYVLSHYHRCKDVRCPVCGPVREAIHRSHEKQKQMQALKQRHQQAVQQNQAPSAAPPGSAMPPGQPPGFAPGPVAPAPGVEPPVKRQKLAPAPGSVPPQPYQAQTSQPYQAQSVQPVAPPPSQPLAPHQPIPPPHSGVPGQPPVQSAPPGYVYSQQPPQPAAPGAPPQGPSAGPAPVAPPGAPSVGPGGRQLAPGAAYSNGQVVTPKYTGPKPQEDHTLINCFSIEQIELHIASLNNGLQLSPANLKAKCGHVLKILQDHQHGWVFNSPVDPVELGLPDYFEVIKKPMDLGTIRKKLDNGVYTKLEEFEHHVHLVFDNAMMYNPEGSVVYNFAKEMKTKFEQDYEVLMQQVNAEEDVKRKKGEACLLCGCEKLLFEPPVFYCNGLNCPSKRIRRNSYYYVGGNNQYHWCHQCFQDLKDSKPIELGDISIKKEALVKKKNDEVHEESWVQCDRCERWVHQICALFNTRQNKDQRSEYACPRCTIDERKKTGRTEGSSTTPMAEDLQRTKLSEHLEAHVRQKMDEQLEVTAKAKSEAEGISIEEAKKLVEAGGAITIRQVTSMDRKLEVRERMKKRYAFKNYPDEFNYRCKCIVVFQNLDGVDVILFGLYVYEHGENDPAPNKRCVYVSYLDSVHYMRPRRMRTFIYHEILISYLDYVRSRGFSTAHIWACPPLKGDDYILYAKPEDQKTPKDDRLRQWYIDMLIECQKRGVVGKLTNMYDQYFTNKDNDATILPYMEGDYVPAEVENIIKNIEEGKAGKKAKEQGKKKKGDKKQKKRGSVRAGTRSSGIDEEALKASGIMTPGKDQKSLEEGGRDYVMVKLGETIQPMKESFIVAFLAWDGATEEQLRVPKAIQEYREKNGIVVKKATPTEEPETEVKKEEDVKMEDADTDGAKEKESTEAKGSEPVPVKTEEGAAADTATKEKDVKEEAKPLEPAANGSDPKPMDTSDDSTDKKKDEGDKKKSEEKKDDDAGDDKQNDAKPTPDADTSSTPASAAAATPASDTSSTPASAAAATPVADTSSTTASAAAAPPAAPRAADTSATPASATTATPAAETSATPAPAATPATATPATASTPATTTPAPAPALALAATPAAAAPASASDAASQSPAPASETEKPKVQVLSTEERSGKFAAMAKKRGTQAQSPTSEKSEKSDKPEKKEEKEPESYYITDSKGRRVKVIDDDAEEMDCEFLNNRQAFLNLCQGNHYQFDHLRRAKHSSMMVLWHLHNRDAPKFVQQCTTCSREILTGVRYHCPTCADFDQCEECVRNPNTPRHPHQLKIIPVATGQQAELTDAQRKERQRSIQLHMTLLLHAATCNSPKCPSANCTKMKGLLKHGAQCQQKATGGCNVCKRIWALLQIHARQCKASSCPVPNCMAIRERVRQLKKQQQAMDDRRRQEMNRVYRGGR